MIASGHGCRDATIHPTAQQEHGQGFFGPNRIQAGQATEARAGEDKRLKLDPSEVSCILKAASYLRIITSAGYELTLDDVEGLVCEGQSIDLESPPVKGAFLLTKDYGRIKLEFSGGFSTNFSLWVTPKQREALMSLKKH